MSTARRFLSAWQDTVNAALAPDSLSPAAQRLLLALILAVTLGIRLATIEMPALDRTAWKEIDYLQISTSYQDKGFRFLCPEVDWPAEEPRCTAMELPLVPFATGLGYELFGFHALSARAITLLSFTLLPLVLFSITRREFGPLAGVLAAAGCAAMPLYHPFGRFLFSEPPMILCSALAVHQFASWLESGRWSHWLGALLAFTMAVALKLEPLYLLLPLSWLAFRRFRWNLSEYREYAALVVLALVLPAVWYAWAWHLGSTSLDVFGVLRGHDKFQTATMLTDPMWYRVMRWRLESTILGGKVGVALAGAGLISAGVIRRGGVLFAWLAAVGASFAIVAEGNIDAPYRQLPIVPPLSAFVALGGLSLASAAVAVLTSVMGMKLRRHRPLVLTLALAGVCAMPLGKWADVTRREPEVPAHPDQWELAQAIRAAADPDDLLVAVQAYTIHEGGNDLSPVLYHYSGLRGWTLQGEALRQSRLEALIERGATHLAVSSMSHDPEADAFVREARVRYPVLFENPSKGTLLLDLRGSEQPAP